MDGSIGKSRNELVDSYAGKLTGKDFGNVIRCIRFDLPLSLPPAVAIIVGISTVLGGPRVGI